MKTRPLAVSVIAVLALSACTSEQARFSNAATISLPDCEQAQVADRTRTVSVDDLGDWVQQAVTNPLARELASDPARIQRDLLSLVVSGHALELVADCQQVSITESAVEEQYQQLIQQLGSEQELLDAAAEEGLNRELLLEVQRSRALSVAIGNELTRDIYVDPAELRQAYDDAAALFDQATVSQLLLVDEAEAQELYPEALTLTDEAFQDLVREQSLAPSDQDSGGVVGPLPREAFEQNGQPELGAAIFEAQTGDTLVVPTPQGAYLVRVLKRDTQTLEEATPRLRQAVLSQEIQAALGAELREVVIEINPRFGAWDSDQAIIVPPSEATGRPLSVEGDSDADGPSQLGTVIDP